MGTGIKAQQNYLLTLEGLGGYESFERIRKVAGFRTVAASDDAVIALHQRGLVEVVSDRVRLTASGRRMAERWAARRMMAATA